MLCSAINQDLLIERARQVRIGSLLSIYFAGSGHPGGSLSAADLLTALWSEELNVFPEDRESTSRHKFILSKGHACPALYAILAEMGYLQKTALKTLRKLGSPLQGHPHVLDLPCVEASTGSLGQGFSVAIGMALGLKKQQKAERVYVLLGDGELQEGEIWEGAMCAAQFQLDNLCAIVDYNKLQSDDFNERIMGLEPLGAKWEAFNWHVLEIDGHNFFEISEALAKSRSHGLGPTLIIAHTLKGKGVSFMEGNPAWHGSVKLQLEDMETSLDDLGMTNEEIQRSLHGNV
ncbi:transketolase [Candidatus Nitronereus thalassa]|uniref:Transketolase n=1 Tax=Candidatus Nitronereus thalassa TaxID=3020898 RepID=A0ABU3K612_9BACT|nr:transketolase [Candidatus Nitronereus thalassa]MDT7041845.1 transketolase [Candidatus Nitronereus thalassa]